VPEAKPPFIGIEALPNRELFFPILKPAWGVYSSLHADKGRRKALEIIYSGFM